MNRDNLTTARAAFERLTPEQALSFLTDIFGGNLGPTYDAWSDAIAPVSEAFDAAYDAIDAAVNPETPSAYDRACDEADWRYDCARDEAA